MTCCNWQIHPVFKCGRLVFDLLVGVVPELTTTLRGTRKILTELVEWKMDRRTLAPTLHVWVAPRYPGRRRGVAVFGAA
jgi:hypothetical protein